MYSFKRTRLLFLLASLSVSLIAQESAQDNEPSTEHHNESVYYKEFEEANDHLHLTTDSEGKKGEVVAISPTTMPILHAYIEDICKQHGISMPFIYITLDDSITYNAAARSGAMGPGTIWINPDAFKKSHKAFEAVIAHELGHLKYYHTHKGALIGSFYYMAATLIVNSYLSSPDDSSLSQVIKALAAVGCSLFTLRKWVMPWLSRKFEQQADEFAYRDCNKAEGFIDLFSAGAEAERQLRDWQLKAEDFNNKQYQAYKQSTSFARRVFHAPMVLAQLIIESIDDGLAWLITEPHRHPTDEERIESALKYVAT